MRLLVDHEITAALNNPAGNAAALAYVLEGDPPQRRPVDAVQVRSTSLDLTIGEIFIPGSSPEDVGGSNNGKSEHNLRQGHTAVIRTRESVRMGPGRAAIAFPPSRVSLKGLLMTNPGHIDPGYEGPLHCTVINMGHDSYALMRGGRIMRALFFELDHTAQALPNRGLPNIPEPISTELLARLSVDFVDVERRAQSIADTAVSKATWRAAFIPIGIAIMSLAVAAYFSPLQSVKDEIVKLRSDLASAATKLEEKSDVLRLDSALATMKVQFATEEKFELRLRALEEKLNAPPGGPQHSGNHP